MIVDLRRTFSEHTATSTSSGDHDWGPFLGRRRGGKTWAELHEKPVTIVLGEAGIGKTIEFQSEMERLRTEGKAAFFIPLNQLPDAASWQLVLTGLDTEFSNWASGEAIGYFFLDAVDEARLRSHADFERALAVVHGALGPHLTRVRIAISSRVTDWSTPAVRLAVETRLVKPIERILAAKASGEIPLTTHEPSIIFPRTTAALPSTSAFVVELDPLTSEEARRCARAFLLQEEDQFWLAVADGEYEFIATRPLDLLWMVALWNQRRSLGIYIELIEANISNRLREFNESYEAAGEVLSVDQLRIGAAELAAAAEFADCTFFDLELSATLSSRALSPYSVLSDWQPTAIRRLLATAVFDEASFGRVKFHHRSIREYLAAQWVAKQLTLGVPLQRLQKLFVGRPFGESVLVSGRRAALSWLAAISVEVREWVVSDFPEILLFEGDPQAWDEISANKAFTNYLDASKRGLRLNWFNSPSELMRVGRALGGKKVASTLADGTIPSQARAVCFQIARHAKLADSALIAFTIYRNANAPGWERTRALDVLDFVGTPEQRQAVLADLRCGLQKTNELVAHSLPVSDWKQLSEKELSIILCSTRSEAEYGSGPMARAFRAALLPSADLSGAILLLGAVLASLPAADSGRQFVRFPRTAGPERTWLLEVFPDCFERVLVLLPKTLSTYPAICMEAAKRLEAQRDSGFTSRDQFNRLFKEISEHSELRWRIAYSLAKVENMASINRLAWGANCLVSFNGADLTNLIQRANDQSSLATEREIWFAVAAAVTFSNESGHARAKTLRSLDLGDAHSPRFAHIGSRYARCRDTAMHQRQWKEGERMRKAEDDHAVGELRRKFLADLDGIRDGTAFSLLVELMSFSFTRSGRSDYSDLDLSLISDQLNPDIAVAFEEGLEAYWRTAKPQNPSTYANGEVPWSALVALAGAGITLNNAPAISMLPTVDIVRAAQLSVWELNGPPPWFDNLARTYPKEVQAALVPWIVTDAQASSPAIEVHRALQMALLCSFDVRRSLIAQLAPLVVGNQIGQRDTLEAIISVLREDGLLPSTAISTLCQSQLTASIDPDGHIADLAWLRIWLEEDAVTAWEWFVTHTEKMGGKIKLELRRFSESLGDLKWLRSPLSQEAINVLLRMHAFLSAHRPPLTSSGEGDQGGEAPSERLREGISNVFLATRGRLGHDALQALHATLTVSKERQWVRAQIAEHAALDAAGTANLSAQALKAIASPFLSTPKTEAQLYEQVIARLEEIRKDLEEGPFSERDLFSSGIAEKFLQRWLAAKLRDTQNRRFSVHREEEVDDDNMTDIQLSCAAGNVCIEIKPVDSTRSYSAKSLIATLQTQMVGQYLKGANSSRGILVLMQLDNKTWKIPGTNKGQSFAALISHLEIQSKKIKCNAAEVNELTVFGIRCIT